MERLQKILSRAGVASRRAAEHFILEGRVTVNGVTVHELGTKADAAHDDVRVDGRRITVAERHRYLLLNKPRGYVTTRSDPEQRPTVMALLGGIKEYVYPVGRLDFHSEGLLLLTNDGDLAARLTHPRHEVPRVYEVRVLGLPDAHDLKRLSAGIVIEGRKTQPSDVRLLPGAGRSGRGDRATLVVSVREGRNRQVRKMCEAIGHPVEALKRVAIGPIRDDRLKPGQWRDLTVGEVKKLQAAGEEHGEPRKTEAPRNTQPRNTRNTRNTRKTPHATASRKARHTRNT